MQSKTKIIATMGPASFSKETILKMIKHQLDMVRLNFSWGNNDWHIKIIKYIREASEECGISIPIIQDLSGPRIQEGKEHHFDEKSNQSIITEKDMIDIDFGIEQKVDYIALSFVGDASDLVKLKKIIKDKGGNQKVIAKIERKVAVDNLASIIEEADAIMVARGDLGNEFPLEEIPFIQHYIIKKANGAGKMVIVATQMLTSMVENSTPTRAEVSDIAYAILDGADGIMLSEESAIGKYPVESISMMEKIALVAEKNQKIIKIGE